MAVKVSDLKEQTGVPGPHPILYCPSCGGEYSANKSDYFMHSATHVFKCCRRNLKLVQKTTTYVQVKP